jgi:two-component system sensor histidine kinase KdpD
VTNLLSVTQLESGGPRVKKEWTPLEEAVGSALGRLGPRLGGREVATRLAPELPLVPMDPVLIDQVLVNLLENAVSYTPAGTPVEVAAGRDGDAVWLEVRDRGPSLPPGREAQVFEKFFRAPGAAPGGSGLGLTICQGIARAHGGTIEARNREGGGALFRLVLPLEGEPPGVPREEAGDPLSAQSETVRAKETR